MWYKFCWTKTIYVNNVCPATNDALQNTKELERTYFDYIKYCCIKVVLVMHNDIPTNCVHLRRIEPRDLRNARLIFTYYTSLTSVDYDVITSV